MLKFLLPPMPTPNTSRRNIGGVGSPKGGAVVCVHFIVTEFALVRQRQLSFQWNMGFILACGLIIDVCHNDVS